MGLSYPGFSAVFIHTFSLHHNQEFCLPVHPNGTTGQFFISEMPLDIETQIFHLKERDAGFYGNVSYRAHPLVKASADEDWLIYPSKVSAVLGRAWSRSDLMLEQTYVVLSSMDSVSMSRLKPEHQFPKQSIRVVRSL